MIYKYKDIKSRVNERLRIEGGNSSTAWSQIKNIHTNNTYEVLDSERYIEKNIHFIWVSRSIEERKEYINSVLNFKKVNPSWEIYLWVDDHNKKLKIEGIKTKHVDSIPLHNIEYLKIARKKTSEKHAHMKGAYEADILRQEIIYHYGGMYLDIDTHAIKPFSGIYEKPFVRHSIGYKNNTNAHIGLYKHNGLSKFILNSMFPHYIQNPGSDPMWCIGPDFFSACIYLYNPKNLKCIDENLANETVSHSLDCNWSEGNSKRIFKN